MRLVRMLWKESATLLLIALLSSIGCAVLMMSLLRIISRYISQPGQPLVSTLEFLGIVVAMCGLQLLSTSLIHSLAARCSLRRRSRLVEKIAGSSLVVLERTGSSGLLASLSEKHLRIATALPGAVSLTRDIVFIACALVYLAWLSPIAFALLAGTLAAGYALHHVIQTRATRDLRELVSRGEHLYALFRNLIDGARQLRLSGHLRAPLRESIAQDESLIRRLTTTSGVLFAAASCLAVLLFLALIALMIPGNSRGLMTPQIVASYTMIVFFLLAPVQNIGNALQGLAHADVSLQGIEQMERELSSHADADREEALPPLSRIECRGLTYEYSNEDRRTFNLGPVHWEVRSGEVAFIAGGNGSGKSTLLKLLCGLYEPSSGGMYADGKLITAANRSAYRRQIAAVFADNCLFEGLAGSDFDRQLGTQRDLLRELRLDHAACPADSLLDRARHFSSGERKRMGLMLACQADPGVFVFDEFAADQDPDAKRFFYHEILPDLKARGKIVIVVTHDERFFPLADRLLVLERGMPARDARLQVTLRPLPDDEVAAAGRDRHHRQRRVLPA